MARYSQRCETNYKILLAKAVKWKFERWFLFGRLALILIFPFFKFENQTIYFPQYIDFRGRAYPLPVHLNHIGDDLCRGLLLFDEAKVLGERGLYWLKIQVANLYGKDK